MSLPPNTHKDEPSVPKNRPPLSIMGREANIRSIKALEKQIEEGEGDLIGLKRARNSLLNISTRVPPEILGRIFVRCLVRNTDYSLRSPSHFDGLRKGSYNFLLVCHHWFEVASLTPGLWDFWGNTLQDWKKRYHRSRFVPLDLVLDGNKCDSWESFDESLQNAVGGRVTRGTIRQVHLNSHDMNTLTSIISSLTPDDEGAQNENIESIIVRNWGPHPVDVSKFLARSRLSKLRLLDLSGNVRILSWDFLAFRTTLLTALMLGINELSSSPSLTTSQLLSVLTSNPNLRELKLLNLAIPNDTDGATFQVPLRNLNMLSLTGDFRHVLGLLRQLILPETLDNIHLAGFNCTVGDISQTFGPYMRNYFQRDARFQDRLGLYSSSSPTSISIAVNVISTHFIVLMPKPPFVVFMLLLADQPPPEPEE
ncbi:hypothetical protein BDM02DRAFT_3187522 [Thelephora ganbajun]|uniref:Uncharacterized protein n=1 Tax=Thelephora ganbajun TaxID=370292 RepID=A0ACB6ZEL8_THEGA|nr:hypothetical protein BDM02DRAFT_3187522 [Thelephora ganbajun]